MKTKDLKRWDIVESAIGTLWMVDRPAQKKTPPILVNKGGGKTALYEDDLSYSGRWIAVYRGAELVATPVRLKRPAIENLAYVLLHPKRAEKTHPNCIWRLEDEKKVNWAD